MSSMFLLAFVTSISAVGRIVLHCVAGAYLQKAGILHKEMRKGVSEMFVKLLLPCLLFTRILPIISIETLPKLAWLAAANLVYVSTGLLIGSLSALLCRVHSHSLRRIMTATPAIGHANTIPFMLVGLIVSKDPAFEADHGTGQGYVALYMIMHSITLWGVGMNVFTKEKEEDHSADSLPAQSSGLPLPVALGQQTEATAEATPAATIARAGTETEAPGRLSQLKAWIPSWLNRPMGTAMVTAILGFIPGIKELFVSGPLRPVFGAMNSLGTAGPSIVLLSVGALFTADGLPRPSLVGYAPLCALIVGRLIILPACCIALWMTLRHHLSFFPSDPAFMLVMCLECCTPTAYQLVTVCILQGIRSQELTTGLFYQNLTAIVVMTAWTTFIVYYVI
mmetsp:Transcript_73893/g.117572  ORF Transcript_73893/g.117572 Transcript_73893/m.117572 type:complete len:394 (-) Transcript_73893:11-1192(-)